MDKRERSRDTRFATRVVLLLLVGALVLSMWGGLSLAGFFGEKTYLLALQDNSEMRATGGLMSVTGIVTVRNGNIANLEFYSAHTSKMLQTKVNVEGPHSFTSFFNSNAATFFDSNVQYNFSTFAPKMQSDFYDISGRKVDGIIALDSTAVEEMLKIVGPSTSSSEVITYRNVIDRLLFNSGNSGDLESTVGGTPVTNLMTTVTYDLFRNVRDSSISQKLMLLSAFNTLVNEKHVFFYTDEGALPRFIGSDDSLPATDFIKVVDMNLGNGHSDFGVNRTIDYHVQLLPDGSTVSNLTLTYTNDAWWESDYFTQVLVPPGAELISVKNDMWSFKAYNGTKVTNDEGFTVFATRFVVKEHTAGHLTFLYKLPDKVTGSSIGSHYDLAVIKQAGITSYTLNTAVELPEGATLIHAENVGSHVFTDDAYVHVVFTE